MVAMRPASAVLASLVLLALVGVGPVLATTSSPPSTTSGTSTTTMTPTTTWAGPKDAYLPPEPAARFLSPLLPTAGGRIAQVEADGGMVVVAHATNGSAPLRVELYARAPSWRLVDAVEVAHEPTYVGDMAAIDLRAGLLLVGFAGPGTTGQADLYDLRAGKLDLVAHLAAPGSSHSYGQHVALGDGWAAVAEPKPVGGAIHVFEEAATGWAWARSLSDPAGEGAFGTALAATEDLLFAHASVATGIHVFDPRAGKLVHSIPPAPDARSFAWPLAAAEGRLVSGGTIMEPDGEAPVTYHYAPNGAGGWKRALTLRHAPAGSAVSSVAADDAGYVVAFSPGWLHLGADAEPVSQKWDLALLDAANGLLSFQVARGGDTLAAVGWSSDDRLPIYIWDLDAPEPHAQPCREAPPQASHGDAPTTTSAPTTSGWTTTRTTTATASPAPPVPPCGPCADDCPVPPCSPHPADRNGTVCLPGLALPAVSLPTVVDGRATPLRPLRVELPEEVLLRYHVEEASAIVAQATVALDVAALPVPVAPLAAATKYLHVEPDAATPPALEAVTIEMGLEGLDADVAATMGIHFWDGKAWVDLAADADGIVPATTPEGELRVLEVGRDLQRGIAWAKVSHTSTYALAPAAAPAGDLKVEHKPTDFTYAWIVGGVAAVAVAAVLTVAVVAVRRRFA